MILFFLGWIKNDDNTVTSLQNFEKYQVMIRFFINETAIKKEKNQRFEKVITDFGSYGIRGVLTKKYFYAEIIL